MGRKHIPEEIRQYAKKLYLTLDENGRRAFSFQQIANKCNEKFNEKLDKSTIKRWADRYSWDVLLLKAAQVSVIQTGREMKDEEDPDEELLNNLIAIKRRVFGAQYRLSKTVMELLEKKLKDPRSVKDSFSRLIEVATKANKTLVELMDSVEFTETMKVKPVIVITR